MHWSKKNKGIVIFLIVIVAVVLLCLGDYGLRYYDTPKEETYDYVGSGMLVGLVNPQFYQQVPVEIHAKKAHFIWKNQEDYIQGNVWLDGEKILVMRNGIYDTFRKSGTIVFLHHNYRWRYIR